MATAKGSSSIQTMKIAQNNGSEISNIITDNGSYFLLFGKKTLTLKFHVNNSSLFSALLHCPPITTTV